MTIYLDVYDVTNTTLVRTLTSAHDIAFLDDLEDPGYARFSLDAAATADVAACTPRRVVRFRTGASAGTGDVFAAILQDFPATTGDSIQPDGGISTFTVECRGLLAWLGYGEGGAVLLPAGGLTGRQQNPRAFGWMATDFDETGSTVPVPDGPLSTAGWPDDEAVAFQAATDDAVFRRAFPALSESSPARMFVAATWNTEVEVWLDDDLVFRKPAGKTGLFYEDVEYEDIDHQLALRVKGDVSAGHGRFGFTWVRLVPDTDDDGNEIWTLGTVLRRTFDPDDFPDADTDWLEFDATGGDLGVTVGFVMDLALSEDDDRHTRPWSWSFDGTDDSDGSPWTVNFTREFRMSELGMLLQELCTIEGEPEMTPAGVFRFVKRRGTDRSATVSVTAPFSLDLSGRGIQATRWIYETQSGMGEAVNTTLETDLGVVMERFVQLGQDIDTASIAGVVASRLERDGVLTDEVSVDLPDDVVPYDDVFLGDTITVTGRDGSTTGRVTSFAAQVDDSGFVNWTATVKPEV